MRIRYGIPVLAVVAALALAGCASSTPATTSSAPAGSDPALVKLLPASIKKSGVIQVGVDATYAPNEYKDSSGAAVGWDIDLFNAVAKKLGVKANYNIADFATIIPKIVNGQLDVGVSSFTDTTAREKQVNFVDYYSAGILWASPAGKTVDPDNACGLKVAVETGTVEQEQDVPDKSHACVAAGKKPIQILKFAGQDQATNAVVLGQADAMSADSPITAYAVAQSGGKLQVAGKSFDVAPYGIAVGKSTTLDVAIEKTLQSMISDGSYTAVLEKWGVASGGLKTITLNQAG
jgi:polar amino acid transport system substrate-binding protein